MLLSGYFAVPVLGADGEKHWSFRPLTRPVVPEAQAEWRSQVRNPIDAFILARLKEQGLSPSAEADRRTLVRRLYFDLIGLPPTPGQVEALLADDSPDAYEKLVDELLASPRYGERWARHWLDVVRYADTHGYDKDKLRPNAWPYRDYVIRSLNEDKPYGRFVREQLAADHFYPDSPELIPALGFIAAGPWDFVGQVELREGTLDKAITRNLDRDDMVAAAMNTFVSLTAQCARCHDHKFDPISIEDYYSLQAVFAAVDRAERPYGKGAVVYAAATQFKAEGTFTPTLGKPRAVHVLRRGSEKSLRQEVGPGTVGLFPELPARFTLPDGSPEAARRAALAEWVTDPRNPLTWRSIVNRVWQHHFGRGIVDTPSDFGLMGAPPTHPQLLDWLAVEFRDGGQSLKHLHRLIVTSSTYRQVSTGSAQADSDNRYLWRMSRRRLDAESLRDSVLMAAAKLDLAAGGPGFRAFGFGDDHSPHYKYAEHDVDDPRSHRRSIYRFVVRSVPDPFMETLDCAEPSQAVPKRNETLTPLQALAMLNNPFMVRMAEHFAARVEREAPDDVGRIEAAWRHAVGRAPSAAEAAVLLEVARRHGLASVCRLIFNANEFVFVD